MVEAALQDSRQGKHAESRGLPGRLLIYGTGPSRRGPPADRRRPGPERQAEKDALKLAHSGTFEKVARHYLAGLARKVRRANGSIKTYKKAKWMLETFIFPKLGDRPIGDITASELSLTPRI
jgi:hypothetical protein